MSENPIFSYTKRDYESSRQEGLSQIPVISRGNWTDLNATDPGIIMLDYVHALADMIQYYQDHQALEAFVPTAKERVNLFRLARQFGYQIPSSKGAEVVVTFHAVFIDEKNTIKIPKHTKLSTIDSINYLTKEDAYLKAGSSSVEVPCYQGEVQQRTYIGTGISKYSNEETASDQIVTIASTNVDTDSISIVDSLGRTWKRVDRIAFASAGERAYEVVLNYDNTVSILFGDGNRGIVPKESDTLTIEYVLNIGEEGNVGAGSIVNIDSPIYSDSGEYIEFVIVNEKASTGGTSAQSSIDIRDSIPTAIKTQDRAITLADFESLAKLVPGVIDARAYDINVNPDLCMYHEVKVLIVPEKEDSIEILKKKVYDYLYARMIPPTNLQILSPVYETVNIHLDVKKIENYSSDKLEYDIKKRVTEYFNNRSTSIGETFYPTDLAANMNNMEGIRYITSITPSDPVYVSEMTILKLGDNITVNIY